MTTNQYKFDRKVFPKVSKLLDRVIKHRKTCIKWAKAVGFPKHKSVGCFNCHNNLIGEIEKELFAFQKELDTLSEEYRNSKNDKPRNV